MKRTQSERANCESGCGMILQSCYDEAVADIDAKVNATLSKLATEYSPTCSDLAIKYTDGALQLANSVGDTAETQPGWLGAELKLQFARQRLENIDLIMKMCK